MKAYTYRCKVSGLEIRINLQQLWHTFMFTNMKPGLACTTTLHCFLKAVLSTLLATFRPSEVSSSVGWALNLASCTWGYAFAIVHVRLCTYGMWMQIEVTQVLAARVPAILVHIALA